MTTQQAELSKPSPLHFHSSDDGSDSQTQFDKHKIKTPRNDDSKDIKKLSQQQQEQPQVVNVLNMLDEPEPLQNKKIKPGALEYDIKLGWVPKAQITGPIPISFTHSFLDQVVEDKVNSKSVVYLGYRPTNTFDLHQVFYQQGKKYPFYQFHLCKSKFLERFFKKFYSNYEFQSSRKSGTIEENEGSDQNLSFDSFYEGGNLDMVYFEENEYRMLIRVDSNTKGHCNYFNFKVKCQKTGSYRLRIMNISKNKSLFERGMKPYIRVLSKNGALVSGSQGEWKQNEKYCSPVKFCSSFINDQYQIQGYFYSLRFDLNLEANAEYQISYGIPFVYSQLITMLDSMREHPNVHIGKLCHSLSGVEIPLLTVSANQVNSANQEQKGGDKKQQTQDRQQKSTSKSKSYVVVITGRIHPAECNGSHIVNGLIKALLDSSMQSKKIRKNIIFKIVPMLNPDGVIMGNTRTGFAGKDLNRKFSERTEFIFPEVISLRDYVLKLKEKYRERLLFVVDIHGHSTRKGSFFFGPQYPVIQEEYTKCRMLPKMYSNRSEVFRYYSCKFKLSESRNSTSRGFFNGNGIRTYTHQTSMHSYYNFTERKDEPFTVEILERLGSELLWAIGDYLQGLRTFVSKKSSKKPSFPSHIQNPNKKAKDIQQVSQPQKGDLDLEINEADERESDKMASDKADSQSSGDDVEDKQLSVFYQKVNENREYFYEELVKELKKNKNQTADIKNNTPSKSLQEGKLKKVDSKKEDHLEKLKVFKEKKEEEKLKTKINWAAKVSYTPKKTLFEEYEKVSNVVFGRGTIYKPTNGLVPKLKNSELYGQKRYSQHQNSETINKRISELESKKFRKSIYSVPHIKWDLDKKQDKGNLMYEGIETEPASQGSHSKNLLAPLNEQKRYKSIDFSSKQYLQDYTISTKQTDGVKKGFDLQNKIKKSKGSKIPLVFRNSQSHQSNATSESSPSKLEKIRINKDSLQKLLLPSGEQIKGISKHQRSLTHAIDSGISQASSSLTNRYDSSSTDLNHISAISNKLEKKKKELNLGQGKELESQGLMTQQEEYLCKRWEKQIVAKTIKTNSLISKEVPKSINRDKRLLPKLSGVGHGEGYLHHLK